MDPEEQTEQESQGHPAWQEILSEIPEELHGLVKPKLEEWDKGVQAKLQEQAKFDAYRPLVENGVPLEAIEQAMYLAHEFETNPELVVERAIDTFGLEKFKQQQAAASNSNPDEEEEYEVEYDEDNPLKGLENHPAYQQLKQQADALMERQREQDELVSEQEAAEYLEQYLGELHEEKGEFDDLFVTALMANGVEPDDAIQQYQDLVENIGKKFTTTQEPESTPVVMGGAGNTGSGIPVESPNLGSMSKGSVADIVAQMVQQSQNQ